MTIPQLRDYQERAIELTFDWMRENEGHPCIVLPTGAGKSHVGAAMIKRAVQSWPGTRVLMLTLSKELISQNLEKLREHWPAAPIGVVSASLNKKQFGEPVTVGGIGSVRNHADRLGHVDLLIIDEADAIHHREEGSYRKLISELSQVNPYLRCVGMTGTPWRLGHGRIDEDGALFSALIEPVTIEELIEAGHLAPLRSKLTRLQLDTSGVKKRGGEFIESDLQAACDTDPQNLAIVRETIELAGDRKHWLTFCTGVAHSERMRDVFRAHGVSCEAVTGETPSAERDSIITDFKAGRIRCLTSCDALSIGFDCPGVEVIVFARPTASPRIYAQQAGRGLRPAPGKEFCLVADFAGNVARHGPVTRITPPAKKGKGTGEAPTKTCPEPCCEILHISCAVCPTCGHVFPPPPPPPVFRRDDDIMGLEGSDLLVTEWRWRIHRKFATGEQMLAVKYIGTMFNPTIDEYFNTERSKKATRDLFSIVNLSGAKPWPCATMEEQVAALNAATPPSLIEYRPDGKYFRVIRREWNAAASEAASPNRVRIPGAPESLSHLP